MTGWAPVIFPKDEVDAAAGFGVAYPCFDRVCGPFVIEMGVGRLNEMIVPAGTVEGLASWFKKLRRAFSITRSECRRALTMAGSRAPMGLSGKLSWGLVSPELLVVRSPWMLGYMA